MNDKLEDLLKAFEGACECGLKFLVSEHEARHETGFSTFEGRPPILKEGPFPQSGLFWFISRYTWRDFVLDIGYGDRELIIEPMSYYLAIGKRFSPWEILTAAAIPKTERISGATWVGTVDFVRPVGQSPSEKCPVVKDTFTWYIAERGLECIRFFPVMAGNQTPDWVRKRYEDDAPFDTLILWRIPDQGLFGIKQSTEEVCIKETEVRQWVLFRYHDRGQQTHSELQVELEGKAVRQTVLEARKTECQGALEPLFSVLRLWYPDRTAYDDVHE